MGKQFANIITLIMSGEIFAEGLKRMGMIDLIIEGVQNIGFGPIPMTIVMVAIIMISAIIMGSGAAPFYAFIALAPTFQSPLAFIRSSCVWQCSLQQEWDETCPDFLLYGCYRRSTDGKDSFC